MQFNTTSKEIRDWCSSTKERFDTEPGFISAIEADATTQRDTEKKWLSNPRFSYFGGVYPELTDKLSSNQSKPLLEASNSDFKPAYLFSMFPKGCDIVSYPEGYSISAKNKFLNYIIATRTLQPSSEVNELAFQTFERQEDINHNTIISLFGLNQIRMSVPNFLYTYGFVKDSNIMIVENPTSKSILLNNVIDSMSSSEFFGILMQISFALKSANEKIGFTHYNLSPKTIILRPIENQENCFVSYEKNTTFINCKKYGIAVLYDFTRSHAFVKNSEKRNVSFGFCEEGKVGNEVSIGIFRDRSNPMCDIYHFLITSYIEGGEGVKTAVSKFMKYFNKSEEMDKIVLSQIDSGYNLPLTTQTRGYNFDEFINFAKKEAKSSKWDDVKNIMFNTLPKGANVVLPGSGIIGSFSAIPNPNGLPCVLPENFEGFYDMYSSLVLKISSSTDRDNAKELSKTFIEGYTNDESAYNICVEDANENLNRLYSTICKTISTIKETGEYKRPLSKHLESHISTIIQLYYRVNEIRRLSEYCTYLFWKSTPDELPEEMIQIDKKVQDILDSASRPVATIIGLLAEDCKIDEYSDQYASRMLEGAKFLFKNEVE